jgi:hypothetical protein
MLLTIRSALRSKSVWVLVIYMGLVSACQLITGENQSDLQSEHIVLDNPCASPCWYGIIPGQTSHDEALAILRQQSFVDQETIHIDLAGNISWRQVGVSTGDVTGGILFADGTVESINLRYFEPPLSIQQLLDLMGPPQAAETAYIFPGVDRIGNMMIWPEQGLRAELELVEYEEAVARGQIVLPETRVMLIEYIIPVEELTALYSQERLRYFQEWRGLESIALP